MGKDHKPFIIAILNQKGGSGKTTLATNLAYAFFIKNQKTLLIDSDPQGSARDWNEVNQSSLVPVVGLDRETIGKDLEAIWKGYDFIIIDGAPQIEKMCIASVKISDFVLIPVQPSPYDIWACAELVDIIKARQEVTEGRPKSAFVISRAIKNTKLSQEVMSALEDYKIPILSSYTTQRVIYPTSAAEGKTVFCELYSNPASKEIMNIQEEIMEILSNA
jgi:chromosome partitioning protein